MRNLKYILFMFALSLTLNNVNAATCKYGDSKLYFTCTTSSIGIIDSDAECTIGGTQSGQMKINPNYTRPSASIIEKCDTIYYYLGDNGVSGFYASYEDNPITSGNKKNLHEIKKMDEKSENIVDADLSKFNGKSCYWESNNTAIFGNNSLAYSCTVINGELQCSLTCANSNNCEDSYYISDSRNDFNNKDFINGNIFLCPSKDLYLNASYNSFSNKNTVYGVTTSKTGNIVFKKGTAPTNEPPKDDNTTENNNSGNNSPSQSDKKEEELDLEDFCQGNVLGVFTAFGWVFFAAKIIIPIALIVFGFIDLSKAVVSSKDDEIKKSIKTLITRAIAGVIIFVIPSFLNLVVNLVGNRASEVYHGTFADCTSCMLDPTQKICTQIGDKSN
ncbi:MAG: hypothetical protein OSJ63_05120 [Bacilli bacterium]|nr:hypothetical protein [Bacilli bacterium]